MVRSISALVCFLAMVLAVGFLGSASATAAEVGQAAPAFDLAGSDGKTHKLADYKGKVVVLVWHGVQCPWDRAYQPYLTQVSKAQDSAKVVFLAINSNKVDSMDSIKALIAKESIPYAILKDPGNKIADAYGAKTTPHIFIVDGSGVLRYVGGIEKAPASPAEVTKSSEQYLAPALQAILAGKEPSPATTISTGCSVKRESK